MLKVEYTTIAALDYLKGDSEEPVNKYMKEVTKLYNDGTPLSDLEKATQHLEQEGTVLMTKHRGGYKALDRGPTIESGPDGVSIKLEQPVYIFTISEIMNEVNVTAERTKLPENAKPLVILLTDDALKNTRVVPSEVNSIMLKAHDNRDY